MLIETHSEKRSIEGSSILYSTSHKASPGLLTSQIVKKEPFPSRHIVKFPISPSKVPGVLAKCSSPSFGVPSSWRYKTSENPTSPLNSAISKCFLHFIVCDISRSFSSIAKGIVWRLLESDEYQDNAKPIFAL